MRCQALTTRLLLVFGAISMFTGAAFASPIETVLYDFQEQGLSPKALVADDAGNLYGTTAGGAPNEGIVYELSPPSQSGGSWAFTVLYAFQGGLDGAAPIGSLILDRIGNLYGATRVGGGSPNCRDGCGTVFELSPPSLPGGSWTESQLYVFQGGPADGYQPSGVVFDQKGNFYGTTSVGGSGTCATNLGNGCGTVFQLTPPSNGSVPWKETILYNFQGGLDGSNPTSGVIPDFIGNLYGETSGGGDASGGTTFELTVPSQSGGAWTEEVYSFNGATTGNPLGGLTSHDSALFGTTSGGGSGHGTVFQLALVNGKPTETVVHNFTLNETNYSTPDYGVVFDSAGNLYGATAAGSCGGCYGIVFMLRHPSKPGGQWDYIGLYGFDDGSDGGYPSSGVIVLNDALYGTTYLGGDLFCNDGGVGCGAVYSISK